MLKNIHLLAGIFLSGLAGSVWAAPPYFEGAAAEIRGARVWNDDIAYVSGGVGESARSEMRRIGGDYNLHLIFSEPTGAYLAFVDVVIEDERGRRMFDTTSQGPWLFADLPPGTYRITARSRDGVFITRTIDVGTRPIEVNFTWG